MNRVTSRAAAAISVLGLSILSFIGGTSVVEFEAFPYVSYLREAYRAASSHSRRLLEQRQEDPFNLPR